MIPVGTVRTCTGMIPVLVPYSDQITGYRTAHRQASTVSTVVLQVVLSLGRL
jgi:hypothetical protein